MGAHLEHGLNRGVIGLCLGVGHDFYDVESLTESVYPCNADVLRTFLRGVDKNSPSCIRVWETVGFPTDYSARSAPVIPRRCEAERARVQLAAGRFI